MRICIAGAGNVGRSIAKELITNGHEALLIDRDPQVAHHTVSQAQWLIADACELETLRKADLGRCDVAIAATGDDKVNLVFSLLARTEFGVSRTVARINHPSNEWLFDEQWGIDVAVSTPRIMSALVEEAVSVGDVVRLMTFTDRRSNLVEIRLPEDATTVGRRVKDVLWPEGAVLVALVRDGRASAPHEEFTLEAHDELLFVASDEAEESLRRMWKKSSQPVSL